MLKILLYPSSGDGIPDGWEIHFGLNPHNQGDNLVDLVRWMKCKPGWFHLQMMFLESRTIGFRRIALLSRGIQCIFG